MPPGLVSLSYFHPDFHSPLLAFLAHNSYCSLYFSMFRIISYHVSHDPNGGLLQNLWRWLQETIWTKYFFIPWYATISMSFFNLSHSYLPLRKISKSFCWGRFDLHKLLETQLCHHIMKAGNPHNRIYWSWCKTSIFQGHIRKVLTVENAG